MKTNTLRTALLFLCALLATRAATAQNTTVVGDMDGDGRLTVEDVTLLVSTLTGNTPERTLRLADGETPWPDTPDNAPHEYVDLGLPSGTLWATCNIGAATPEQSGDYFAWGETRPKTTYNWGTYALSSGSDNTLTHYCTNPDRGSVDGLTQLSSEHDAAAARWGADWCMPTEAQVRELLSQDNTKITPAVLNGVQGFRVSRWGTGDSIFLPAAGYIQGSDIQGEGLYVYCWSKSLDADVCSKATLLSMDAYGGTFYIEKASRMTGNPIRPVRVKGAK